MKGSLLCAGLFLASALFAQSQPDTIRAAGFSMQYLPAGKQSYLVYIQTPGGFKKSIWLWERETRKEKWNGRDRILVRQQWTSSDTGFNSRQLLSVCEQAGFVPVYHHSRNSKGQVEAYVYGPDQIRSDDTVQQLSRKGFTMPLQETAFNWELDLETFSLLPLQEGKSFVICFYHPGSPSKPDWYTYTVTGSETLRTVDGKDVECLKLYTTYANNRGSSTWWLSRKTHEVLKMEEIFGNIRRYKIRLSVE